MRRLTVSQRQALLKWGCLLLSAVMLIGSFAAVPYIVKALPRLSGSVARDFFYGEPALGEDIPTFALGSGVSEMPEVEDAEGEYEPENPIPIPVPGEYDLPVTPSNLCWYEVGENASLNIINRTKFDVNLNSYLENEFPIGGSLPEKAPLVLIVHTHGSESYLENGYDFYSPEETFRSEDKSRNVVHIGEVLCEKLNSLGIRTIHDTSMYDTVDFNKSYAYSREGIKKALAENPTIRFVIDLHRDSVFDSNDNNIKPLTTIDGKKCAQLMLVVGTNQGGSDHPNWRDNLTFATYLQQKMNDMYPTLARPINLRTAAFNQGLSSGSVLLEVGSCGNTQEEAENAVLLFAECYASLVREQME